MFTTTMPANELELRLFDGQTGLPPGAFDVLSLSEMLLEQAQIDAAAEERSLALTM